MKKMLVALSGAGLMLVAACSSAGSGSAQGGGSKDLNRKTSIGVINTVSGAEVTQRWTDSTTYALKQIGLKPIAVEGKGDPSVQSQAIASFISQRVQAIILDGGFATGPIAQQLRAAKAAHIPVFAIGGGKVPDPQKLLTGNYACSPSTFGKVLANYVIKKFPKGSQWVYVDVPAIAAAHDVITAGKKVLDNAGWKLAGSRGFEASDFASKTAGASVDLFRANPNAKVLFTCCDYVPTVSVPALKRAGFTTALNTGTYDNLSTLALIRGGAPLATVAVNTDVTVGVAIDQMLKVLTGGKADQNADQGKYVYKVIDKTNLPPAGQYLYPPKKTLAPYIAKWKKEYPQS